MAKRRTKRQRSEAARKGWRTRRRTFLRRSRAAKKGWRRRKAKEKIEKEAKKKIGGGGILRGRLKEWLVTWIYTAKDGPPRQVDFTVIARSESDAALFVVKAVAKGQDSEGADLTWMSAIPWDEIFTVPVEEENATLSKDEIKALGEGYVTVN